MAEKIQPVGVCVYLGNNKFIILIYNTNQNNNSMKRFYNGNIEENFLSYMKKKCIFVLYKSQAIVCANSCILCK